MSTALWIDIKNIPETLHIIKLRTNVEGWVAFVVLECVVDARILGKDLNALQVVREKGREERRMPVIIQTLNARGGVLWQAQLAPALLLILEEPGNEAEAILDRRDVQGSFALGVGRAAYL